MKMVKCKNCGHLILIQQRPCWNCGHNNFPKNVKQGQTRLPDYNINMPAK